MVWDPNTAANDFNFGGPWSTRGFLESHKDIVLAARGYELYRSNEVQYYTYPSRPPVDDPHCLPGFYRLDAFPYAHVGGFGQALNPEQYLGVSISRTVHYAQDREGRHIAIKCVPKVSVEFKVFKLIHEKASTEETFCHLIPVVEMIDLGEYYAVVMSRWNRVTPSASSGYWFRSVGELLDFLAAPLKALAFLHQHRIAHRDIAIHHVLQNHIRDDSNMARFDNLVKSHFKLLRNRVTEELRRSGKMLYAVIDFDLCSILEEGRDRRPYLESYVGQSYALHPNDTAHGEYDYDPLKYDVALLGNMFCLCFQHLIPCVPILAPLFDGMINTQIEKRFTAKEALKFLLARRTEMTPEELALDLSKENQQVSQWEENWDNLGDTYDRWVGLPTEFVEKWAPLYKVKYPSRWTLFLRWALVEESRYRVVAWIRRQWDRWFGRARYIQLK